MRLNRIMWEPVNGGVTLRVSRNPATVHAPIGGYVHQIAIEPPNELLIISGQVGRTLDGSVPPDPHDQLAVALDNLRLQLEAAGMTVADLVKLNYYLVGDTDAARRAAVIGGFLGTHRPCSTLVYVVALARPEYLVEVEGWASAAR